MATVKEREPRANVPEGVSEIPEGVSIPESVERKDGVKPSVSQVTTQVTDNGQPLYQTSETKTVTINLPASEGQMTSWSKGKDDDSITWLGRFWLRMIKRARHFGWKIVSRQSQKPS